MAVEALLERGVCDKISRDSGAVDSVLLSVLLRNGSYPNFTALGDWLDRLSLRVFAESIVAVMIVLLTGRNPQVQGAAVSDTSLLTGILSSLSRGECWTSSLNCFLKRFKRGP